MSPELIATLAFGFVMVVLGILAIWIVKWSTDRMLQAAEEAGEHQQLAACLPFADVLSVGPSRVVLDPESLLPILQRSTSWTLEGGADQVERVAAAEGPLEPQATDEHETKDSNALDGG